MIKLLFLFYNSNFKLLIVMLWEVVVDAKNKKTNKQVK